MLTNLLRSLYYRVPEDIRNAVLVRLRASVWLRTGIVFVHIPKAAGTSINQALYGRFMGHVRARDIERWGSEKLKSLPSFAVTRNPWDRAVSAFRFSQRLHLVDWREEAWHPPFVQRQVPKVGDFGAFVTEWLERQDIRKLNAIYQPQSLFVCDEKRRLLVDHLGKLEDLRSTEEFIAKHIGRKPDLVQANRSGGRVDYRTFYSPELVKIVADIYAEDVERFGYAFGD